MERHINGSFRNDIRINLIDRIEDDSIIYLIDAFIDALIQSSPEVYKRKTLSCGRKSFDNKIYLKLYLYSYLNGYTSSRKISRECKYNLELIWLLEDLHPNYWSINNYRNKNKDLIHKMTIEFRKFLKSNVYIDDEYTAYDGSKFIANGDKAVSIDSLNKRLKKYDKYKVDIISYLTNLDDEDLKDEEKEKNKLTLEDELKVIEKQEKKLIKQKEKLVFEILKKKQEKIDYITNENKINNINPESKEETAENLKLHLTDEEKKIRYNLYDFESKTMKYKKGFCRSYNLQTGVNYLNKMIVYAKVVKDVTDNNRLADNIEEQILELNLKPKEIAADKGYYNINDIKILEDSDVNVFISPIKENRENFKYIEESDSYICKNKKELKNTTKIRDEKLIYRTSRSACKECSFKKECGLKKSNSKEIHIEISNSKLDLFKKKMKSIVSIVKIRRRGRTVEHPYGTLKRWFGYRDFVLKGLKGTQVEIDLITTSYNLKRLWSIKKSKEKLFKELEIYFNVGKTQKI